MRVSQVLAKPDLNWEGELLERATHGGICRRRSRELWSGPFSGGVPPEVIQRGLW